MKNNIFETKDREGNFFTMIERDKFYRMQKQTRGQRDTDITGRMDRLEIGSDRCYRTRDKLRDRKRQI